MNAVPIHLPDEEAKALYRHLHRLLDGQDLYCETYRPAELLLPDPDGGRGYDLVGG